MFESFSVFCDRGFTCTSTCTCMYIYTSVHVFINVHIDSRISWVIDNQLHSLVPAGVGGNLLLSQELFERLLGFFVSGILWLTYTCTFTFEFLHTCTNVHACKSNVHVVIQLPLPSLPSLTVLRLVVYGAPLRFRECLI